MVFYVVLYDSWVSLTPSVNKITTTKQIIFQNKIVKLAPYIPAKFWLYNPKSKQPVGDNELHDSY